MARHSTWKLEDKFLILLLGLISINFFLILYAFITGRHPLLTLAELIAYFPEAEVIDITTDSVILKTSQTFSDPQNTLNQLGGTKKIAEVEAMSKLSEEAFFMQAKNLLVAHGQKRITFGISVYGQSIFSVKDMGLSLKRALKGDGRSSRVLFGDQNILSTVQVSKNDLVGPDGAEINLIRAPLTSYIGRTVAVQDFEAYAKRDYEKPSRNARAGMLPPKLAQIMLNLAHIKVEGTVLDPFCGTGTVPGEALLRGYAVIASDSDEKAVVATTTNVQYLNSLLIHHDNIPFTAHAVPVQNLATLISTPVDAVVTEGTLGPVYRQPPSPKEATHTFLQLHEVYQNAFQVFSTLVKKASTVVLTLPYYRSKPEYMYFPDEFIREWEKQYGFERQILIPKYLSQRFQLAYSSRRGILYERPDQIVGREVLVFTRTT